MLNKYFKAKRLSLRFLLCSLLLEIMYLLPLTLYITMPPADVAKIIVLQRAVLILENIVCAFMLSIVFYFIMRYEENKRR